MDGQTLYFAIKALETELHSDDCTDERSLQILAELKKLKGSQAKSRTQPRRTKPQREQYMTVLGAYVLDMDNHGRLIGHRDAAGTIVRTR